MSTTNNYVFACQISGVFDVNRNEELKPDDFDLIQNWYTSVLKHQLNGIIFHNNFSEQTVAKHQNKFVKFIKIVHDQRFSPNVYRYFVYNEFINKTDLIIDNIFFTDISDVVLLKNPFEQQLFLSNKNFIFCGDEPEILENDWMINHCQHLREKISDFKIFEQLNRKKTLLNCGIFGGEITIIRHFIENLYKIHQENNADNTSNFTGDMGAFNYLIRTDYGSNIIHGSPVNTVFKSYDTENIDCWFSHK